MNVNPSGYYKWKNTRGVLNKYEKIRWFLSTQIKQIHLKYPSYGYHRIACVLRKTSTLVFSDNLIHKCCKYLNIKSKARHYKYTKQGDEHILYPNRISNHWNADKPLSLVVSDMTNIKHRGKRYEWTYILDTYNNEIISSHLSAQIGDRQPYFNCLEDLKERIKEQTTSIVLHTDQGTVYSSKAFFNAHKDYNIIRSMSRAGTPTDNPIIESINGWIKAELITDFKYWESDDIFKTIDEYVYYFNNQRPAYALNYKSPVQYRTEQGFG